MRPGCKIWFLLGALLPGMALAGEENVLNVYNWADYIAPNTIADSEKEFNISVDIGSVRGLNGLGNKDICMSMAWSGDYIQAGNRIGEVGADVRLGYTAPAEGTLLWFDSLLIPADALHPRNAYLFLNYLMRPEVIAAVSEYTGYANANLASIPFLDPKLAEDPAAYPPMEACRSWQAGLVYDPKRERIRSRLWSRVKTGL